MSFKNFILQPPVELIKEISELKNLFFEIKEGKKFGIKLTNKNTNEYWISSTNNIKQQFIDTIQKFIGIIFNKEKQP